jgi:hypothetical protein
VTHPVKIAIILLLGLSIGTSANTYLKRPLSEIVAEADHVFVAKIIKVEQVTVESDYPGKNTRIQITANVTRGGILKSTGGGAFHSVVLTYFDSYHPPLEDWRKRYEGTAQIFLIRGPNYSLLDFQGMQDLSERSKIEQMIAGTYKEPPEKPKEKGTRSKSGVIKGY